MRLLITTPTAIVAEYEDVVSLVAEDDSGSFGLLPGHVDFVTALSPSVATWRHADGRVTYCAVRRGVLSIEKGQKLSLATREAVLGESLEKLEGDVLARFQAGAEEERTARVEAMALRMKAIRRIIHYLRTPGVSRAGMAP